MEKDILYVKTLGGFTVIWNGVRLTPKLGSMNSQFRSLMQVLLHSGTHGIGREQLEEILFEGRELSDPHHALQVVIYNSKKKLRRLGLPEADCIEYRQKTFFWTEKVPVVEDAAEFEALMRQAESTEDPGERLGTLLSALSLYDGEFLPQHTASVWAASEAKRLRTLFCRGAEAAAKALREAQDYRRLEDLGRHAARVDPLADWETVTMEALVAMNRAEEAQRLYDATVNLYLTELGVRPSKKLHDLLEELGERMRQHHYMPIDTIQTQISKESGTPEAGGYVCSYPVFRGIYQLVGRMMERGGQAVFLMLCTVVDAKGMPLHEGEVLDALAPSVERAIRRSVRQSDTVSRYGKGQYLVLLLNTTREDCEIVQQRIDRTLQNEERRAHIEYAVSSVDVEQ